MIRREQRQQEAEAQAMEMEALVQTLCAAVACGDKGDTQRLLNSDVNVDAGTMLHGISALHKAAMCDTSLHTASGHDAMTRFTLLTEICAMTLLSLTCLGDAWQVQSSSHVGAPAVQGCKR